MLTSAFSPKGALPPLNGREPVGSFEGLSPVAFVQDDPQCALVFQRHGNKDNEQPESNDQLYMTPLHLSAACRRRRLGPG